MSEAEPDAGDGAVSAFGVVTDCWHCGDLPISWKRPGATSKTMAMTRVLVCQ